MLHIENTGGNTMQELWGRFESENGHFCPIHFLSVNAYWLGRLITSLNKPDIWVVVDPDENYKTTCRLVRNVSVIDGDNITRVPFAIALNEKLISATYIKTGPSFEFLLWVWLDLLHALRHYVQESGVIRREQWIFWHHLDDVCELDKTFAPCLSEKIKLSVPVCCGKIPSAIDSLSVSMAAANILVTHTAVNKKSRFSVDLEKDIVDCLSASAEIFMRNQNWWALILVDNPE